MKMECRAKLHFYPPDCMAKLQTIVAGVGAIAKTYKSELLDALLGDDEDLQKWSTGKLPAWDRRLLLRLWLGPAWEGDAIPCIYLTCLKS